MRKRVARIALACGLGAGCTGEAPSRPTGDSIQEPPVATQAVPLVEDRGYVGVVVPGEAVDIAPMTAGELLTVSVREGDRVEAGDALATLDDQPARERLEMSTSTLRSAQSRLRQAKLEAGEARRKVGETKVLVDGGHAARSALQDAEGEQSRANAAVREAQAELALHRTAKEQRERELVDTTLVAPFSGVIADRYADPGTVVEAGARVIRLISGDTLWVRFAVPPADIPRLRVGDVVLAELETLDLELHATVRQIAPDVDSASRLVHVQAQLEISGDNPRRPQTGAGASVRLLDGVERP